MSGMRILAAIFLFCLLSATSFAQAPKNATVKGVVYNKEHRPMPGVVVLIENKNIGFIRTATTSASGDFAFSGVPPALDYKLTASTADGHQIGMPKIFSLKSGDVHDVSLSEQVVLSGMDAKAESMTSGKGIAVTYKGETILADLVDEKHEQIKYTNPHDKSEHDYSCVPLGSVVAAAGVPHGETMRGRDAFSLVVIASAKDNYHVAFSLAELDEGMGPTKAYVCDAEGGKPLPESDAPLKLLVTTDKRPARSVRMLTGLAVKSAE